MMKGKGKGDRKGYGKGKGDQKGYGKGYGKPNYCGNTGCTHHTLRMAKQATIWEIIWRQRGLQSRQRSFQRRHGRKRGWGNCNNCGNIGHTAERCPMLGKGSEGTCNACGIIGHTEKQCPKGKGKGANHMGSEQEGSGFNLGGSEEPPKDNIEKAPTEPLPEPGWDQAHQ